MAEVASAGGRGRTARIILALAIAGAFCVLLALGFWQLHRLEWKEGLIAAANERPQMAAVAAPGPDAWPLDLDAWNYRRVKLTGTFGAGEAHVWFVLSDAKGPLGGVGYFVIAPFTTEEGWHVLVNRGFVPEAKKDAATRPGAAPPEGVVSVEALVRRDDPPTLMTPEPDPEGNVWFSRDVAAMARALVLPVDDTAPYNADLVAAETPVGGLPQAGESRITFSNRHLEYAFTWFGLAACLAGVTAVALLRGRRKRRH